LEKVIPSSETAFIGSGVVGAGGGVGEVDVVADSGFNRDLKLNFCFGIFFDFSAAKASESCFSCYCQLKIMKKIPPDTVFVRRWAAMTRFEYTMHLV